MLEEEDDTHSFASASPCKCASHTLMSAITQRRRRRRIVFVGWEGEKRALHMQRLFIIPRSFDTQKLLAEAGQHRQSEGSAAKSKMELVRLDTLLFGWRSERADGRRRPDEKTAARR